MEYLLLNRTYHKLLRLIDIGHGIENCIEAHSNCRTYEIDDKFNNNSSSTHHTRQLIYGRTEVL